MLARVHLALLTLAICVLAALIGVLLASRSGGDSQAAIPANGWAGATRPAAARVPAFSLIDQEGERVTSTSLRGQPAVFAFIYSHCQDTCPAQVQTIRGALDDLGHDIPVYGVSVDPAHDTQRSAQAFLLDQKMKGRMHFLLGSRAALEPIWRAFGIAPQTVTTQHSSWTVLVDAGGRQRVGFPVDKLTQPGLAHDLERLTQG